MGIIILPFILIAIIIAIISIVFTIIAAAKKQVEIQTLFFGLLIAGAILGTIVFIYSQQSNAYALGPFFIFPFFMIYVPFFVGILFKIINATQKKEIGADKVLFSSVIFSTILFFLFYSYTFDIIETLGIQKIY
jgi:hypothetical protein